MLMAHTRRMALWMQFDVVISAPSQKRRKKKQRIGNDNLISGSLYSLYLVCDVFFQSLFLTFFYFPLALSLLLSFFYFFLSLLGRRSLI